MGPKRVWSRAGRCLLLGALSVPPLLPYIILLCDSITGAWHVLFSPLMGAAKGLQTEPGEP